MSGYKFWKEIAILENDVEYRNTDLNYLKFKRLAEKYK